MQKQAGHRSCMLYSILNSEVDPHEKHVNGFKYAKTSVWTFKVTDLQVNASNKSTFTRTLTFSVDRIFAILSINLVH